MARYTGPVCRLCRREGLKLFLKGERCYSPKCAVTLRNYPPGQHGISRKKKSEYCIQLREKQKARRFYGVNESQFEHYFEIANSRKGITGENLLQILESRLDNVVYRLGFATSRPEARQLVRHGHFQVNGRRVDIPSFLAKSGDEIVVCEKSRKLDKFKSILDSTSGNILPKWLDRDVDAMTGRVVNLAAREDIDLPVQETLIVELYSK